MVTQDLAGLPGHVVVCGMGQLGHCIVRLLTQIRVPVVCLTQATRSDWLREAETGSARVVLGDARDDEVLRGCGILEARALIAATDHDSVNIEVALTAKALRPTLPMVVRVADRAVGAQLEEALGARVLSLSGVAAPLFVAGVLTSQITGAFEYAGELLLIGKLPVKSECDPPVAAAGEFPLRLDDRANWTGELTATTLAPLSYWKQDAPRGDKGRPEGPLRLMRKTFSALKPLPATRTARRVWNSAPTALRSTFLVVAGLVGLSLFIFQTALGLSFVDALYFITSTITTTGYGDITPFGGPEPIKLYAVLLMLVGSAAMGALYSLITGFIVTARFRELLGGHHVVYEGHVIVAGLSSLGREICEELLADGHQVVAVDRDSAAKSTTATKNHTTAVIGDARLTETLERAGASRALAIIAATDDDATNLAIGLAAKRVNSGIRAVVRIFDPEFAEKARHALRIDLAVSAPSVAAPYFVGAALHPGAVSSVAVGCELLTFVSREASPLEPASKRHLEIRRDGTSAQLGRV